MSEYPLQNTGGKRFIMKSLCKLLICAFVCIHLLTSCKNDLTVKTNPEISFLNFETTPNNGGKYYKIPAGTREIIVTDIPIFKKIRLVRVNASENTLNDVGTVQLSIYSASKSVKSVENPEFIKIEDIKPDTNISDDFTSQNGYKSSYTDDMPFVVPFVDNTDYKSLLYDFSADRSIETNNPSFMIAGNSETNYSMGSERQFNVQYIINKWNTINATVIAEGTYCYIWIADENYNDLSTEDSDNKITTTQAQALARGFDSLYEVETTLMGGSYTNNPNPSIYINPQNKISIFIYDINNDYTPSQASGVFGMFWTNDFYRKTAGMGQISKSNEMELLCIDSHFTDKCPTTIISTISHEFAHMLYFINKILNKNIGEGSIWYKEMGAMMAEDLLATYLADWYDDFEIEYDSVIDRLRTFNSDYYKGGIINWKSDLSSYARTGIFGCWLLRNYGGASLFRNIINNDYFDIKSLAEAIHSMGYSDTFGEVFTKYALSFAQPNAVQYTLKKSVQDVNYSLVAANPWSPAYRDYTKFYNGPVYTSADYSEAMQPYGFWITGWVSGMYTAVKLEISEVSGEQNYLVIID